MRKGYWSGSHTRHRLRYHLVFLPKYRRRVLRGKIAKRLLDLLYKACYTNKWWIHEINILQDHVHLIIQVHPKESVSYVTQKLKGGTSRILRKEFPEIQEFLWGDSFWADGYFAETTGKVSESQVIKYIKEQEAESMPQQG
jgi:putative transposase